MSYIDIFFAFSFTLIGIMCIINGVQASNWRNKLLGSGILIGVVLFLATTLIS